MTDNEKRVNKNSEVETEDRKNGDAVLIGIGEEQVVENEKTSDEVIAPANEISEETTYGVADGTTDEETAKTEASDGSDEKECSDENSENENNKSEEETEEGMNRAEKIVLTVLALILFLLLLWLGIKVYNNVQRGAGDAHNLTDSQLASAQTADDRKNDDDSMNDSGSNTVIGIDKPSYGDTDFDENTTGNDGSSKRNNSSANPPRDDGKGNRSDNSNESGNGNGGKEDGNDDNGKNTGSGDKSDDTTSEYAGETNVSITKVHDDTAVITVTVDGEKIVVPVQTTVFNGRVTKSGVAQGKLFGFNCGVTVMLFYPQTDGMSNTEFSGYMNRTGDSLTILVDVNGESSKLLIKINGLKSL